MPKFTGRLEEIGIGKEATRGTGVAPTFWLPKTAISFDDKVQKAMAVGSYGNITDAPFTAYVVEKWGEGDIEGEINANSFGLILLSLLGSVSTSGPTDSAYTHSYTLDNDVDHPSLSIQLKDKNNTDVRFRLAMINSITIDIALGELVKYTANFISKTHQDVSAGTATYATDHRFVSPNLTFKVANTINDIAAASKISVQNLSLTIEKRVVRVPYVGTLEPEDILNTGINIFGTLELNYEDVVWRDYMLNNTVKAMQIKLENQTTIGSTSKPTIDIIFPKVHFSEWEKDTALEDIAKQTINFAIQYDLSNSRIWSTFDLINSEASY